MPRAPSLELYVLPSGGGQTLQRGLTESLHWNSTSYRKRPATEVECRRNQLFQVACQGGAEGSRTPDLLGAIQALSQLSYSPARRGHGRIRRIPRTRTTSRQQPRSLRGAAFKLLHFNSFRHSRQANAESSRCPSHHPSRMINTSITRLGSRQFSIPAQRAMGGDPTTFVVSQTAHTPPGVVPPSLQPCGAPATARVGRNSTLLRTRPISGVAGNIWCAPERTSFLARTERPP